MAAARVGTTTAPGAFLAPYVPSPEVVVDRMLEVARVGPGDTVYDLGSGDGRVVVAAAQRFGARAVGIELDDQRFAAASARVRDLGLAARARIVHGDLLSVDLRPATVVTLYQLPSVNEMLRPALERQLRPGARVVTHDFPINGWNAAQVVTGRLDDGSQHAIYLYNVSATRKESTIMAASKSYSTAQTSLELSGLTSGALKSFEGGDATAAVVSEKLGLDNVVRKHIAGVSYTDLSMTLGPGMSSDVYDWIAQTLQQKYTRKNGAVVIADYNRKAQSRQEFFNGLISEIAFPACDAGSKDPAFITLKVAPEYTRAGSTNGQKTSSSTPYTKSASLLPSNFRLTIDGLDCSRVLTIDAPVVRLQMSQSEIGLLRDYEKEPANLEIPNLAISLVDDDKNGFREWFDDFVIKGNNSVEKNGKLEYLSSNLKDPILTLTFSNLGIFKLARQRVESNSEQIPRLRAEMYCEQLTFSYGSSASAGKGAAASQGAGTGSGTESAQGGSAYSIAAASPIYVPAYAQPYVASVADKLQIAAEPQNLVAVPRLGRPLKFRS